MSNNVMRSTMGLLATVVALVSLIGGIDLGMGMAIVLALVANAYRES